MGVTRTGVLAGGVWRLGEPETRVWGVWDLRPEEELGVGPERAEGSPEP